METENWTLCFFCSFPIPAASSPQQIQIPLEVWRNEDDERGRNKQNSSVNLQRHSDEQVAKKTPSKDILFKYFLSGCKDKELKDNLHSPSFQLELCEICEGRAVDIQELHLDVKRIQGKLTDRIKEVKQIIIANSRGTHHRLFSHFRTFVRENEDTQQVEIMSFPEEPLYLAEGLLECPWKIEDIPTPMDIKEELKDPLEPSEDEEQEMDATSPLTSLVKKEEMEEEEDYEDDDSDAAVMNHVDLSTVSNTASMSSNKHSKKKPYSCNVCQERFNGVGSVLSHKIRAHNHPKLECDLCPPPGKSYTNHRSLKDHQLRYHPDKVQYTPKKPLKRKSSGDTGLPCELCGEVFENCSKLILHTHREHPRKSIKCPLCPKSEEATLLSPLNGLPRHLDEVHGMSDLRHICSVPTCGKIFYARIRLHAHNDTNHKTSHPCKECTKVFPTFSKLHSHNVTVHRETRGLKCTLCSERFNGGRALLSHKIHVHNHPKLECGLCPKTFMVRLNRKNHWLVHHPEEAEALQAAAGTPKAFRTKCRKDGDKKADLAIPNVQKNFSCEECGAVMKSKFSLQQHLKSAHVTSKDFSCELCGFRTKTDACLKDHMRRHNAQIECPQCSRKCQNKSTLMKHMKTHSEEKQFSCEVCGEAFKKMRMLKLHSLKHEMEEKVKKGKVLDPCECPECGKVLSRPDGVKIHMIVHSEERKFDCVECGKKFKMNQDLRRHMIKAHDGGDKNT